MTTAYGVCPLCEAICGLEVELEGEEIVRIRGDERDPFSRGYICPKAIALKDVHSDPDRLRKPRRRIGDRWVDIGWDEAIEEVAERLTAIQKAHGKNAVGLFVGNPSVHSYGGMLFGLMLLQVLGTRNVFTANSVDGLPRLLTSYLVFGSQALIPVPDLDRTDFLLVLGANPAVSNGSLMTAPDCKRRLRELRERGGKIVVIDPRRTETAELADRHHFIRPGTDALLLAALVHAILEERSDREELSRLLAPFTPERAAPITGIAADQIRSLARDFSRSPSAVCYGRMGTCVQEFGTLSTWLCDVLNAITGNLDREGGAMFPTPAVDLASIAASLGQSGHFDRWRSRVRGLPEFNGELPSAALAEEIDTEGEGRIRALITHAGNPVLSLANGRRLERALEKLDFMVSIDLYQNETTRHADIILPSTFGLEKDHYPLVFHALAVRNTAKYAKAMLPSTLPHDHSLLIDVCCRIMSKRSAFGRIFAGAIGRICKAIGPRGALSLFLRLGPHEIRLRDLEREPHGIDLGPLVPRGVSIDLTPAAIVADLPRLAERLEAGSNGLVLIGRRHLRSNNSWMHNSERLVRGKNRCTLLMHPSDADPRGISSGDSVRISSRVGSIEVEAEVSEEIMTGVVSLPHGWGHDRAGTELSTASAHAGKSCNDITDDARIDPLSGSTSLNGVPVTVTRA